MELTNEFEVAVPIERAWAVLTDLERIAPCLPGAQLLEVEGDEYRGAVKIKVGPITTSYNGAIRFTELDESAHRAVLRAEGRETRGQGNVAAVITATMSTVGAGTLVSVTTDLTISGKVAQFGRGVLADVSAKLLDQFAVNLEKTVLVLVDGDGPDREAPQSSAGASVPPATFASPSPSDAAVEHEGPERLGSEAEQPHGGAEDEGSNSAESSDQKVRKINSDPVEPMDLAGFAGGSVARRVLKPLVISGLAIAVIVRRLRPRRG